jgi:hypothetical protein
MEPCPTNEKVNRGKKKISRPVRDSMLSGRCLERFPNHVDTNLLTGVGVLELSVRAFNVLQQNGLDLIIDLVSITESELLKFKNCGLKTLTEIRNCLQRLGLDLSPTIVSKSALAHIKLSMHEFNRVLAVNIAIENEVNNRLLGIGEFQSGGTGHGGIYNRAKLFSSGGGDGGARPGYSWGEGGQGGGPRLSETKDGKKMESISKPRFCGGDMGGGINHSDIIEKLLNRK